MPPKISIRPNSASDNSSHTTLNAYIHTYPDLCIKTNSHIYIHTHIYIYRQAPQFDCSTYINTYNSLQFSNANMYLNVTVNAKIARFNKRQSRITSERGEKAK